MQSAPTALIREDVQRCGLGMPSVEKLYTAMNYDALHRHIVDGASLRLRLGRALPREAVVALNRLSALANSERRVQNRRAPRKCATPIGPACWPMA